MKAKRYPHMLRLESELWTKFIVQYDVNEVDVEYDVRLGEGAKIVGDFSPAYIKMIHSLSTKRADVIWHLPEFDTIVELKERAGLSVIGQLLGYKALYIKQRSITKPIALTCVCAEVSPDMEIPFATFDIGLYVLGYPEA